MYLNTINFKNFTLFVHGPQYYETQMPSSSKRLYSVPSDLDTVLVSSGR